MWDYTKALFKTHWTKIGKITGVLVAVYLIFAVFPQLIIGWIALGLVSSDYFAEVKTKSTRQPPRVPPRPWDLVEVTAKVAFCKLIPVCTHLEPWDHPLDKRVSQLVDSRLSSLGLLSPDIDSMHRQTIVFEGGVATPSLELVFTMRPARQDVIVNVSGIFQRYIETEITSEKDCLERSGSFENSSCKLLRNEKVDPADIGLKLTNPEVPLKLDENSENILVAWKPGIDKNAQQIVRLPFNFKNLGQIKYKRLILDFVIIVRNQRLSTEKSEEVDFETGQ